jgi:hypothetical protein
MTLNEETNKRASSPDTILSVVSDAIYRLNPFKILKLKNHASLLDAEKSAQKLRQMKRLGINDSRGMLETVSEQEIRDAIEALRDPRKRIIYELFWENDGCDSK